MAPDAKEGGGGPAGTAKSGFGGRLRRLPFAEKVLAGAAAVLVVAFVIRGDWSGLFARWFDTCSLLAALAALGLTAIEVTGVRFLGGGKVRTYALLVCALVPALGFLADALRDFFGLAILGATVGMAYAGVKIVIREDIF